MLFYSLTTCVFRIIIVLYGIKASLIYGGERVYFFSIEMLLVMLLVRSLKYLESSNLHSHFLHLCNCLSLLLPALCAQWVAGENVTSLMYIINLFHSHVWDKVCTKNKFSLACIVRSFPNFESNSCVSDNNPRFL